MKDYVKDLYKKISENLVKPQKNFTMIISNSKMESCTTEARVDILGKGGLCNLGFGIPRGKVTAWQAVMLNKAAEELPSESDLTGADDIELQEIAEKASGIISQIKDVQTDTEDYLNILCEHF